MEYAFRKRKEDEVSNLGFDYDYESVMQYEETAFSKNGRPTMSPKTPGVKLGSTSGFSKIDVQKINKFYGCEKSDFRMDSENVKTSNGNGSCSKLRWKKFQPRDTNLQKLMVFGGNDTFGNKFYICRTFVTNGCLICGQMFQSLCYVAYDGKEVAIKEFQVLTHSINDDYKWQFVLSKSKTLPSNSVIAGECVSSGHKDINFVGNCFIRHSNYFATVIGHFIPSIKSIGVFITPFNGKIVICKQFNVLICK